jgi:hypothetical protein
MDLQGLPPAAFDRLYEGPGIVEDAHCNDWPRGGRQ